MLNKLVIVLIIFIFSSIKLDALENKILLKINNEIVTTIDIANEINYLKMVNKEIVYLDKITKIKIAKNSIIKNKIKKIELVKAGKKLEIKNQYLNEMIKNTYKNIGFNNLDDFTKYLDSQEIKIEMIEEKIIIDAYWNQMIYKKYKDKIKIDKEKILDEISNRKTKNYELLEIFFNVENKVNLNKKFNIIKESIEKNGFKNTALIHGTSDSAKDGGALGWINESAISKNILKKLSSIEIGEFTNPILVPGGFLILKISNIKESNIKIDTKKEVDKIVNIKINEQLNQFSNLYLNKVRKNVIVDEL